MLDINLFIAKNDDHRDFLKELFVIAGYTTASDGKSVIFSETTQKSNNLLAHDSTLKMLIEKIDFIKKIQDEDFFKLNISKQNIKVNNPEKCKECNGNGYVFLSTSYNEYEFECKSCEGLGRTYKPDLIAINDVSYELKLVSRIIHEETKICIKDRILYFKNNNQFGLIMPVKNETP